MKKFSLALALFLGFGAFNAQAFDLTEAANKMADGINNTAQAIEDKKAEQEAAVSELSAFVSEVFAAPALSSACDA